MKNCESGILTVIIASPCRYRNFIQNNLSHVSEGPVFSVTYGGKKRRLVNGHQSLEKASRFLLISVHIPTDNYRAGYCSSDLSHLPELLNCLGMPENKCKSLANVSHVPRFLKAPVLVITHSCFEDLKHSSASTPGHKVKMPLLMLGIDEKIHTDIGRGNELLLII
ncbi:hypothetical protein RF11_00044 [Thelohanellus kitauei]|uniref:Uncharacterized protein n=1 Tax=Thelohanellus kitauei TaxID=669202 RepID=A0A0C2JX64_THEKT|nr:hypothetical protein RF11_00044 [Thelohanellus kitauei]